MKSILTKSRILRLILLAVSLTTEAMATTPSELLNFLEETRGLSPDKVNSRTHEQRAKAMELVSYVVAHPEETKNILLTALRDQDDSIRLFSAGFLRIAALEWSIEDLYAIEEAVLAAWLNSDSPQLQESLLVILSGVSRRGTISPTSIDILLNKVEAGSDEEARIAARGLLELHAVPPGCVGALRKRYPHTRSADTRKAFLEYVVFHKDHSESAYELLLQALNDDWEENRKKAVEALEATLPTDPRVRVALTQRLAIEQDDAVRSKLRTALEGEPK